MLIALGPQTFAALLFLNVPPCFDSLRPGFCPVEPLTQRNRRSGAKSRASRSGSSPASRRASKGGTTATRRRSRISANAPSPLGMAERRRNLRRQRGQRVLKYFWRLLVVGAAAGGLVWLMGQPIWLVRSQEQITIKGNQAMSADSLKALVPVDYPQSLLKVKPNALEDALLEQAPLLDARISRRLIPPGLVVRVRERQPVAVAELTRPDGKSKVRGNSPSSAQDGQSGDAEEASESLDDRKLVASPNKKLKAFQPMPNAERVLLDDSGEWVSLEQYDNPEGMFELPSLQVLGMRLEYKKQWPGLYESIRQTPVQVQAIDWRDPSNLKLKTDLGNVHLGPYGPQFSYQLEILDRMRHLPSHAEADQIAFIDLKTPTVPRLQMKANQSED